MKVDQSTLQRLDSASFSSPVGKLRLSQRMWFTQDPTHLSVTSQIPSQQPGLDRVHDKCGRKTAYWHPPGHACWTAFQHVAGLAHRQEGKVFMLLQRMPNCPPLQQVSRTNLFPYLTAKSDCSLFICLTKISRLATHADHMQCIFFKSTQFTLRKVS